jgi:plasmid stabilization system protein ParE
MRKQRTKANNGDTSFEVVWDIKALNAVEDIYRYILQKSLQGAESVREEILSAVGSLDKNPERFPIDKDLKSPYQRCLVRNYRIIFRIYHDKKQVLIIHVWNSKRSTHSLFKEINQ